MSSRLLAICIAMLVFLAGCSKQPEQGKRTVEQSSKEVSSMHVSLVKITGTYLAPAGPMMQSQGKKPNYELLGAIVGAPQGSVFFKFTGPAKTVTSAANDFDALIASMVIQPGQDQPASSNAVAGVTWTIPARWSEQPPRPMRVTTYAVLAAEGDTEGGECAVFYFGNDQGGSVDANIDRWVSQFEDVTVPGK